MKPVSFVRTSPQALGETGDAHTYDNPLSLDAYVVEHPTSTYFVRVGEFVSAEEELGVLVGDVLAVDRAVTAEAGRLVLIVLAGELQLTRLHEGMQEEYTLWGTVIALVRKL